MLYQFPALSTHIMLVSNKNDVIKSQISQKKCFPHQLLRKNLNYLTESCAEKKPDSAERCGC